MDSCDTDMGRIGPIWIRLGSVLDLFWPEMDSCENRSGSDRPDMDSVWIRSGLVLARHGFVREPIWYDMDSDWFRYVFVLNRSGSVREPTWIGSARYGVVLDPFWSCIDPTSNRATPIWVGSVRYGFVLGPFLICFGLN